LDYAGTRGWDNAIVPARQQEAKKEKGHRRLASLTPHQKEETNTEKAPGGARAIGALGKEKRRLKMGDIIATQGGTGMLKPGSPNNGSWGLRNEMREGPNEALFEKNS